MNQQRRLHRRFHRENRARDQIARWEYEHGRAAFPAPPQAKAAEMPEQPQPVQFSEQRHVFAWKTIPQAEYDNLVRRTTQLAALRIEVHRALERLSGPEYRLDWIQDAVAILKDAILD